MPLLKIFVGIKSKQFDLKRNFTTLTLALALLMVIILFKRKRNKLAGPRSISIVASNFILIQKK